MVITHAEPSMPLCHCQGLCQSHPYPNSCR